MTTFFSYKCSYCCGSTSNYHCCCCCTKTATPHFHEATLFLINTTRAHKNATLKFYTRKVNAYRGADRSAGKTRATRGAATTAVCVCTAAVLRYIVLRTSTSTKCYLLVPFRLNTTVTKNNFDFNLKKPSLKLEREKGERARCNHKSHKQTHSRHAREREKAEEDFRLANSRALLPRLGTVIVCHTLGDERRNENQGER